MTWGRGNDYTWIPAWFRLQRNGDTFTALESSDGVTWFTVGSATMPMASSYYVGLAVCSNGGVVNTTTFDNVKVVSEGVKPPAPTGLKGKAVNNKRIDLSWTGSPGAPSYSVKRSSTNGGPYETIATGLTDTTYSNTGLSANTTYYYVVSSASFAGESENSLEAVVTTHDLTIPHSPTGVIAVPGNANITLSWSAAEDAANYQVKRALTNEGPYTLIDTTTVTSYVDASASTGTTYYYVVSARNIKGESPNSTPVSAKLTTNAHSYWAFNETDGTTAFDVWGERHATTTGVSVVPGAAGNAIRIDAGSDVTLPPDVVSTLNDFTIAIWMKLDATSNWSRLFDFGSGTTNYMFLTPRHGATGNTIRYAIRTTSVAEQQINCPVTAVTGTWTHVAVTLSGTVGILYVNGIEVGRNNAMTLKPSDLGSTTQNWIGRSQFATDPRVSGLVDDLRIYSRALAPSEISDMFNALAPAPPANLIATGTNQVTLSWDASAEALLYNVKRSTVDGGPYTVVAANVSDTSYVDTGVSSGGPYYYIVTAKSGAFESTPSTQASVLLLPAVPTQITAAAWNGRIDLSWTASAGALTYDVKRAIAIEGPYTPIANVATQSFRDTELTNGINYYYVVSAVNTTGASANSSSASATPFANPNLSEWLHGDVGSIGAAGNAGYRDGVFTLHGSGADIWGNADGFHFMYQPLLGDGAIVARVVTQQNTYNSAKAGVMIRESLNANSTHAMVALAPGIGTEFIRRAATGGSSAATSAGNAPAPYWVRLVRSGNTFTAYRSANGIQWTMLGTPQTITMGSAAYIGLVLCSHNNAVLGQATFDNVNIATTTPVITSSSTAIGTFDSLFHYSIEATNSPYYFSATGLPDSLILDTHNGLITGKPLVSGMFPVTINTGNALGVDTDTVMLVIKRNQTIAFNALADKKVGDIDFDPQAIPTSGLPVSYTSSNTAVATIVDGKIHITGKGTTLITASQPGDSTFYASPPVSQSLTVIQLLHNPYGGVARVVPGVVEAEDFDTGGEGIAYHDITPLNVGLKYRRKEGVDIETCTEGGFNLSWMLNNEWLNYTLNVQEDGTYKIDLRVADVIGLGQLRIEIDGENKTGTIDLDPTKGIQRWATVSRTIELKSGLRAMRLFVERGGCNINKLTFTKIEDTRTDLSRMPSVQRNTQTEEMDFSDGCLLYPNPVVDKLTIVLDEEFGEGAEVHLFNDKGQRIVYEKTQGNIHILDLENAAPGIYLLKIRNAKEVITKKLVKI
jgi:fibronectin type 3 domain-containing protein/regulation of enolase protein 1 (concanavalin A-like superfamily)